MVVSGMFDPKSERLNFGSGARDQLIDASRDYSRRFPQGLDAGRDNAEQCYVRGNVDQTSALQQIGDAYLVARKSTLGNDRHFVSVGPYYRPRWVIAYNRIHEQGTVGASEIGQKGQAQRTAIEYSYARVDIVAALESPHGLHTGTVIGAQNVA
jgi:hypothetical protein